MAETANAIATLAAALVGSPAEEAWDRPPALPGVSAGAAAAARCGIETATADLMACRSASPSLPGSRTETGRATCSLATSVPVNATIDAKDAGMAAEAARRFVAAGFDTLKLKVGVDAEGDLLRVAAVRKSVGPDVVLRIDANGGWSFAEAARLLPLYADLGVRLCEQPIAHGSANCLAQLRQLRTFGVSIASDESCRAIDDLAAIIEANAADVVVIKPMVCGLRGSPHARSGRVSRDAGHCHDAVR